MSGEFGSDGAFWAIGWFQKLDEAYRRGNGSVRAGVATVDVELVMTEP
jgi:hypothetical protein